ncbi:MAG: YlbF family regulator [Anaerovoracaceae bacterium]
MNVYDQAHSLAQAIRESEEFKQYDQYKKIVKENPQLNQSLKDLMKKQMEMQAAQMMGQEVTQEAFQQIQQLSAILMQDPTAAQYLQCQMRFSMMMADVYKIIGETADLGQDLFGGTGGVPTQG